MTEKSDDEGPIRTKDLRQFAEFLKGIGVVFESLSGWLESNGVMSLPDGGIKTARRGANYLANFTSNVLTTYHNAQREGTLPELAPEIVAKGHAAEAVGKNLAAGGKKKKKGGTNNGTRKP